MRVSVPPFARLKMRRQMRRQQSRLASVQAVCSRTSTTTSSFVGPKTPAEAGGVPRADRATRAAPARRRDDTRQVPRYFTGVVSGFPLSVTNTATSRAGLPPSFLASWIRSGSMKKESPALYIAVALPSTSNAIVPSMT